MSGASSSMLVSGQLRGYAAGGCHNQWDRGLGYVGAVGYHVDRRRAVRVLSRRTATFMFTGVVSRR
jgi:hypothetical protein